MKYLGSKNRISKQIKLIIQKELQGKELYIEPFVGGANMIDKIDFDNKIGSDINEYLIELLIKARDNAEELPTNIPEELYIKVRDNKDSYSKWYVGCIGFCATFGAKWFGGYARDRKTGRNMPREGVNNLIKQAPQLKGIDFRHGGYEQYKNIKNAVIYCDIPYQGSTKYKDSFDHEKFFNFIKGLDKSNTILVSEYDIKDDDFEQIWEKEVKVNVDKKNIANKTEKLYKLKGCK